MYYQLPIPELAKWSQSKDSGATKQLRPIALHTVQTHVKDWPYKWLDSFLQAARIIEREHNGRLLGLNIKRRDGEFLAVVSVEFKGIKRVGFVSAPTIGDLMFLVGHELLHKKIKWKRSKY